MKLDKKAFGIALGLAFSFLYAICSLLVIYFPSIAKEMTGEMAFLNFHGVDWNLSLTGFFIGIVGWFIAGWATGWLTAFIYNRFVKTPK